MPNAGMSGSAGALDRDVLDDRDRAETLLRSETEFDCGRALPLLLRNIGLPTRYRVQSARQAASIVGSSVKRLYERLHSMSSSRLQHDAGNSRSWLFATLSPRSETSEPIVSGSDVSALPRR